MFRSSPKEPAQLDPAEALLREVGAQLRQVRQERGEDLEHVAQYLRIRPLYLNALEHGDLSVMPGRTYALGFLRSYADYLGFDGDELIARIRTSVADLTGRTRLRVRSPLPESRLPKTPILVLSLAALAGIYAGWLYVDHSNRAVVEVVSEVPDDLQALVRDALPKTSSGSDAAATTLPEAILPEVSEPDPAPEVAPVEGTAVAAPEPDLSLPAQAPIGLAEQPPIEPEAGPDATGLAAESGVSAEPIVALAPGIPGEAARPEPRSASDILARLDPVVPIGGAAPTIYGVDEGDVRVILRARSRSWVQISSADEAYRWARILEPGDAFVVPDRPDLLLWTGNAGGIEVIVDGAPLSRLGPDAAVLRGLSLQPGALLRRLLPATDQGTAP
jgi:cytoskeletal protein RodZ